MSSTNQNNSELDAKKETSAYGLSIPAHRRNDVLHTKYAGKHLRVRVAYEVVSPAMLVVAVASREDAMMAGHCYRPMPSIIEPARDGSWLVAVFRPTVEAGE